MLCGACTISQGIFRPTESRKKLARHFEEKIVTCSDRQAAAIAHRSLAHHFRP